MLRKELITTVTAAALLAAGYTLRQPVTPPAAAAPLRLLCGSERWPVKTFADGDRFKVDLTPRSRTIKQLNTLVRPAHRPQNGRVAGEFNVYRVTATVMTSINENDGDIHLALVGADGSRLIAEAPEPACSVNARSRTAINKARLVAQQVQQGDKVVAAGVGFFDFAHNQTGHATNYIEVHPLLTLKKLG
jgi:hypothetical protein